jgi:predicted metalloprotease with PDZ domain
MIKRCALVVACLLAGPVFGSAGPTAVPVTSAVPLAVDRAFPGTITLAVDASDTRHKVYQVHETIPVVPGSDITLLYPQWETASHAPTGSVSRLAGLMIYAGGEVVSWSRDPYNTFAFHVHVPPFTRSLDLDFQFLSPATAREGALSMTPALISVPWQSLLLYPAGYYVRDIPFAATLKLPPNFSAFTSLTATQANDGLLHMAPVSLETLVDAPVYAGTHTQRIQLTHDAHPVFLDLLADTPASLAISDDTVARFTRTVQATEQLFGTPPWQRYEMLVSLSDALPGPGGTEHLSSAENNLQPDFFTHQAQHVLESDLIWHELVHAWNGKHRVPQGLWTADFNTPADDSLLWVYEGQTQFWGEVLAARYGERSHQDTLDMWAFEAATMQALPGRSWKSLADSSLDPVFDAGHHITWRDWQRREDYYLEGPLFWLDIDAELRQKSHGKHSLNDLAGRFFGDTNPSETSTYTFADLCDALNHITPNDWAMLLKQKLDSHDDQGLLDGLAKNGYQLVFDATPTNYFLQNEQENGVTDLTFSMGLAVDAKGVVRSVAWQGPAFRAGISVGTRIQSVDGEAFSADNLKAAVAASDHQPIRLVIEADGEGSTIEVPYQGPLRYPHLARIPGTKDGLAAVFATP